MATISEIKFKRSKTAGQKPAVASLKEGELAINLVDKKLFTNTGERIEDLTLRSGGKVDGALEVTGNIKSETLTATDATLTGDLKTSTVHAASLTAVADIKSSTVTTGNITATGDVKSGAVTTGIVSATTVNVTGNVNVGDINAKNVKASYVVQSDGDVKARTSLRVRGQSSASSHLWFEGDEVNGEKRNFERAVIYAPKQTANNDGVLHFRVQAASNSEANSNARLFTMTGLGDFTVPGRTTSYRVKATSMMVGGGSSDNSGLGDGSIAIGDNDTGFRDDGDGKFSIVGNSRAVVNYDSTTAFQIHHRKQTAITPTDNNNTPVMTPASTAVLQIDTSKDGNGVGGNGFTLIGYHQAGGKYGHYFRGKGFASLDMDEGVKITKGTLEVAADVKSPRFNALGDIAFRNTINRHIRFEYADANANGGFSVDGYIYKDGPNNPNRRQGIRINCLNPVDPKKSSGDYVFGEDGNLTVPQQVQPGNYANFDSRYQNLFQLGANVNLDTLVNDSQLGEYAQHANANTSLSLNYPEAQAGHLTITGGAGVQQTYRVYDSSRIYVRSKYSNKAWTPWDRIATESSLLSSVNSTRINMKSGSGSIFFEKAPNTSFRTMRIFYGADASRGSRLEIADDFTGTGGSYICYFERHPAAGVQLVVNGKVVPQNWTNFDARYQAKGTSDIGLKDNIRDFDGKQSLENIEAMDFKKFEYKSKPGIERRGVMAQDLKLIDPEYVTRGANTEVTPEGEVIETEFLALDTNPLLMDALAAIKVLSAEVCELKEKLNEVTGQQ